MPGDLPPELLDLVFSHLHEGEWEPSVAPISHSKYELDSCSRVCRMWNAAARSHLFRDITYSYRAVPYDATLNERGDYNDTLPKYGYFDAEYKPNARYKTFPMFFSFVAQSPIAQYNIRRLRLDAWPRDKSPFFYGQASDFIDASLFVQLLQLLPHLCVLHLCNVGIARFLSPRNSPILHPSLHRMSISSVATTKDIYHGWPELAVSDILDCFAEIEELHLVLPNIPRFESDAHEDWPPLKISRLILGDSMYLDDGLFEYLFEVRGMQRVSTLSLEHLSPDSALDLLCQMHFDELRLACTEADEYCGLEGLFDISSCTELKHLAIDVPFILTEGNVPAEISGPTMFPAFVVIIGLLEASLPRLTRLTLHLCGVHAYERDGRSDTHPLMPARDHTLQYFEQRLVRLIDHFSLSSITFAVNGDDPRTLPTKDVENLLKRCCPRLAAEKKYSVVRTAEDATPSYIFGTDRYLT
ncbi:uncharacterized protein PHACADRAFT_205308 [Phanerochaete carnosa HHB-10118-sp]|uniref:F-box domain-containing protein n=1 Tax=Phanerochaete carnosa (strain HHB-10118-sp) TaxID=650164 RepID=K5W5D8_PHACS|nr:uncharacterized protein PHACADRAFT_205308 [Phanerochaete carnosa HHB-10118-sp]EKM59133.1 hypothetical protein PHACADRAFT_205308 [Phanerochaete carnosa HHB-10118-sp]